MTTAAKQTAKAASVRPAASRPGWLVVLLIGLARTAAVPLWLAGLILGAAVRAAVAGTIHGSGWRAEQAQGGADDERR